MSQPKELPPEPPRRNRGKRITRWIVLASFCALALLLGLFLYQHFFSNPTCLRSGVIFDTITGKPIPGVNIQVFEFVEIDESDRLVLRPETMRHGTDTEGRFSLNIPEQWIDTGYIILLWDDGYVITTIGVCPDKSLHKYFSLYTPLARPQHSYAFRYLPEDMKIGIYPVSHAFERPIDSWWKKYWKDWFTIPDLSKGYKKQDD